MGEYDLLLSTITFLFTIYVLVLFDKQYLHDILSLSYGSVTGNATEIIDTIALWNFT